MCKIGLERENKISEVKRLDQTLIDRIDAYEIKCLTLKLIILNKTSLY